MSDGCRRHPQRVHLHGGAGELLVGEADLPVSALALQDHDLHAAAPTGAVVAHQDVVRPLLGLRRGVDLTDPVEEPRLQRHLGVDRVEVPPRVLPPQHLLRHHQSQPDAQLLGLGHLVVVHHVAGVPGQREMTPADVERRAVSDVRPVPGHPRQRGGVQERGRHAQLVQHLRGTGAEGRTQRDGHRHLGVRVVVAGERAHLGHEVLVGDDRQRRLGAQRPHQ
ncbi:hypothetical protein [Micromonospora sp. NPDC049240]|uniref:hypothetical protein n=1 Tax=Micromonospora sp. NPDC049240 TaxID=3155151 RepID=UPI0033E608E7